MALRAGSKGRVSIHAPACGSDQYCVPAFSLKALFQSTLPRGERQTSRRGGQQWYSEFQSTLPRGERPVILTCNVMNRNDKFQSTLPRGERRPYGAPSSELRPYCSFQSTLPRGERHLKSRLIAVNTEVSIHAPAWGATYRPPLFFGNNTFQSTLPRGERLEAQY